MDISFNRDIIMDWNVAFQQTLSLLAFFLLRMQTGSGHEHGHHGSAHNGEKPTGFHDPKVVQDAE